MITRTRRRLLPAARAFTKEGTVPPGIDEPGIYFQVRSGDFVTDAKISWRDASTICRCAPPCVHLRKPRNSPSELLHLRG
jgi:hypothetical protein